MSRAAVLRLFAVSVLIVAIWEIFIGFSLFSHRRINLITFRNLSSGAVWANSQDAETEVTENVSWGLNQHIWEKPCLISLEQLCNYPIFPKAPDNRTIVENANLTAVGKAIAGIRLLGYLRPNVTSEYYFLIASNGFAELWLSEDKNWKNAKKIAYINSRYSRTTLNRVSLQGMKSQMSDGVSLSARMRYYFEVIYVQDTEQSDVHFIEVAWKRPGKSKFDIVDRRMFLPYKADGSKAGLRMYDEDLPDVSACVKFRSRKSEYLKPETRPFLDHKLVKWALKYCEYRPSYIFKAGSLRDFKHFHGVHNHTKKTSSYPFTEVNGVFRTRKLSKTFIAEYPLDAKEAILVVSKYLKALKRVYPR